MNNEINITRILNAPPELVFAAWSKADMLKQWYAPPGCDLSFCTVDFREGGAFHHCVSTPMGDCWCKGVYKEIVVNQKIVFTIGFSDETGNAVADSPVGKDPEWPMETTVSITFTGKDGKTTMHLHQTADVEVAKRTGAYQSWLLMFDLLEKTVLPSVTN
ncbi:MAG: hypothetical protein K0S33_1786 [Bacteroidetes bacterium]|jgi:uncharacterized protein YndB with AHSA1/START domain|nr:hypothetical protein [Bacteroidota bacterium]